MQKLLASLLLPVAFAATGAEDSAQAQFNKTISTAYGYLRTIDRLAIACAKAHRESSAAIASSFDEWSQRNAESILEIQTQWEAYVEREAKTNALAPSAYRQAADQDVQAALERLFSLLGGVSSERSKEHCLSLPSKLSSGAGAQLEVRLRAELLLFRECGLKGTCPNLNRQQ